MALLSLKCHALGGVNGVHSYTCAFNTQYSLCFFLFSCGFLGLGKIIYIMFHLKLSKEMCRLYLSWEISTGDMTASHCVRAEVQPAAREPHINDFLDAMGTQDCPWI